MSISQLAKLIPESPTLKMNEIAKLLRERGEAVIHLGGGEPKTKTPIDAILRASAKLNSADVKYTPSDGIPALKQAIIRYTEENYHRRVAPENIIASNGAKQALSILLQTIINPQDEVIFIAPYWVSYPELTKIAYGVPVAVTPEDGTFLPRMQDIEQAVGSYTKALIINSPGNPTGVLYPPELIKQIVAFCEKKDIYLIMDDIYHKLVFEGKTAVSALDYTKKHLNNSKIIIINGVSKAYAMTGFRIGWAVGAEKIIEAMNRIQAQTTSCPSALLQEAAVGALNGIQSSVDSLRLMLENNRNVMMEELNSFDGVHIEKPGGTFYCFPDFSAYYKSSHELANFLLEKVRVVTVPGKDFGREGHLRLSYCGSIKDITEGIARIKWALDPNAPNEIFIGERKLVRDWV